MSRLIVLPCELQAALPEAAATHVDRWGTSLGIAQLQGKLLLLLLHVGGVEASEEGTLAVATVSQPTVLQRVTSAEVPITMPEIVRHKL